MRKWWIVIAYINILIIGLTKKDYILNWLQNSDSSWLPVMFFFSVLIASIPFLPFTLFAGLMGVKFGAIIGLLINWFGILSASLIYFFLSRYYFRDYFTAFLIRYKGIKKFQSLFEKNAFIAILFGRMIAIIPPQVINIYCGASEIRFRYFFMATAIGMLPPMFLLAYSGEQIFSSGHNLLLGVISYLFFLVCLILFYKLWFNNKLQQSNK
ncbi:TVP38/TMEM64 family protein [Cytobacillus oceanisediminis]|uniref:TVP38/TMEM64 family membrane protein n=1 Tax=Cytobacillus oceanisediminis TaxID=665099 RepID=A0A562JTT3_9BACI|nr:TVP38/TMEM64 family protein [Cytobacillus oceanisediminis]TWH86590.1 putative membrane protein YdjX (TVP38/TMEM64 family) [Cytobacillus oceanisediminis]